MLSRRLGKQPTPIMRSLACDSVIIIVSKASLSVLQCKVKIRFTCGHKASISAAAMRTIFTPSSLLDIEQARLATCHKHRKHEHWTTLFIMIKQIKQNLTVKSIFQAKLNFSFYYIHSYKVIFLFPLSWKNKTVLQKLQSLQLCYYVVQHCQIPFFPHRE
jgi:hypothetical protein